MRLIAIGGKKSVPTYLATEWKSTITNSRFPENEVPEAVRPLIIQAIESATGHKYGG